MVRLTALLAVWYISSLVTSLSTKEILRVFPYPMTLSAVQQFIAAVMGWASLRGAGVSRLSILRDRRLHQATLPVATVMVIALASYRWALMMATVSFVHTVKTLGPVFTIAFSRLLLGERLPASRYASVVPVVLGVALTSVTEAEFALSGLLAILLSTAGQALQAVVAKRLLRERDVAKGELFAMAALHAFLMLLPLSILLDFWRIHRRPLSHAQGVRVMRWLLLNGGCSYINQYSGLSVLDAMSSPLSHALANVMKRATVITAAMVYQAKPVTPLHVCGVALSVFGAVGYQNVELCEGIGGAPSSSSDGRTRESELVPLAGREGGSKSARHKRENDTEIAGDSSSSSDSLPGTPSGEPTSPPRRLMHGVAAAFAPPPT